MEENKVKKELEDTNGPDIEEMTLDNFPELFFIEKDPNYAELYDYLLTIVGWKFYAIYDIFEMINKDKNVLFCEWIGNFMDIENQIKNKIVNCIKEPNLLINFVYDYICYLYNNFFKYGERIRCFILFEYFIRHLECLKSITNCGKFYNIYRLYFNLCRDTEIIFDHIRKKNMFLKNPTFYYEKCLYYESIHHHKSANQSFIDGFKNLSETFEVNNNNDNENLKILKNNYFIFEERMRFRIERDLDGLIKEDWIRVDQFIHALIKNYKDQKKCMNDEESYEEQLLKSINIDFNLREGKLIINDNNDNYINNKGLIIYKDDNDIKNDPDINRITSITCIWEILKNILSSLYVEWKKEYDKFDIQVQEKKNFK